MPLHNRAVIAAAGSGKTSLIVQETVGHPENRTLVTTYTINNRRELESRYWAENGSPLERTTVSTWFSFLLHECVRPYQNSIVDCRVQSICMVNGRSAMYVGKDNPGRYYLNREDNVYTDKLAELACSCNEATGGQVVARLEQLYDHIYIDEIQDLAGYDLELVELLLKSKITVTFVGDVRQATYSTNNPKKNKPYIGAKIILKFEEWKKTGLLNIDSLSHSHRCNQSICDLSDSLYPDLPTTTSMQLGVTGHDGIYAVAAKKVLDYYKTYEPRILRWDKRPNV